MQRRLLTAMLAVAVVAVLALTLGVDLGLTAAQAHARVSVLRVGLLAVGSLALAATLALAQARRLTRAVRDLAKEADRIGSGDTRPIGRRYGIGELDRVAEGLDNTVQRVTDLISAEQDFAVDASHQLRTPLTALSMRLEEMVAAAEDPDVVREEGAAALAQTDRLTEVVGQLLDRARRSSSGAPALYCIDDVIAQQVLEWEPAFRAVGRKLEMAGERGLRAYLSVGGLSQVIATLLDNALTHGGGTVTVRTSQTPRSVVIEVRDEGKGIPASLVHRIFERSVSGAGGTGLGLALAKSVASSDGGQLVLVRPRPATFAVIFPQPAGDPLAEPVVAGPALRGLVGVRVRAHTVAYVLTAHVSSAYGGLRRGYFRYGVPCAGGGQGRPRAAPARFGRHTARGPGDDGEQVVRPLPRLAAGRGRADGHDLRGAGRQVLPQLPARAGLPGMRVQRP